jgi:hypothetical protein
MRDIDIRVALRRFLRDQFADDPQTLYLEEVGLSQGDARVDLAVINGAMHGYEIKSDRDKLTRLPRQTTAYGACFDTMTVVVGRRFSNRIESSIPAWWGILRADDNDGDMSFSICRRPQTNMGVEATAIVRLLWKSESQTLVLRLCLASTVKRKSRSELWAILAQSVPLDDLRRLVRETIKARGDWRSGQSPFRCGGSCRSSAKSRHSRENREWLLSRGSRNPPR